MEASLNYAANQEIVPDFVVYALKSPQVSSTCIDMSTFTYTGGIVGTNGHLLTLPGGTVLVDAPDGVAEWLQKQGHRVDALLLTHQHFDHVQGAARVKREHGCPIYAWTAFARELTLERLLGVHPDSPLAVPAYEVDHVLEGQDTLSLLGEKWQLYFIPGHSADSVCFHCEAKQLLFGGDVLFRGSVGRTDFPGGSFEQLAQGVLRHLWPLPGTTQVFPGHGEPTTIGHERAENPFLQGLA
jgi:hydroxyacylglutathione hydrolase